jgi:hypothetical protein
MTMETIVFFFYGSEYIHRIVNLFFYSYFSLSRTLTQETERKERV